MPAEKVSTERIIAAIGGDSGSGKSFFLANLKDAVIYDTDLGGGLAYADARIKRNGSERVALSSYAAILDDIRKRAGAGTLKTNVCIDHATMLQQEANQRHNPTGDSDYGRGNAKATGEWRKIRETLRGLDCNLFVTAHTKSEYQNEKVVGIQVDGAKNMEGDVHIVLYLQHVKGAGYPSIARVIKWRRDPEDPRGVVPRTFTFTAEEFAKIGGEGMTKARENVKLASADKVAELERLLGVVKLPEAETAKWLTQAGADTWKDMTEEQVDACVAYIQKMIQGQPATAPKAAKKKEA